MDNTPLTPNQGKGGKGIPRSPKAIEERIQKFVHYYLLNGRDAARAYEQIFGVTNRLQAQKNSSKFLAKPKVIAELEKQQKQLQEHLDYDKEKILTKLIKMLEDTEGGGTPEKNLALKIIQTYVDITGMKASTKIEQVNYNIDATPLTINFTNIKDIEDVEPEEENT